MIDMNDCQTSAMFMASESYSVGGYDIAMSKDCDEENDDTVMTQMAA